jgi:hypothetical protein
MADELNDLIKKTYPKQDTQQTNETLTTEATAVEAEIEPTNTESVKTESVPEEFKLEHFNKKFNKEFKSEDELKSLFDLPTKVTDLEAKASQTDKLKADYDALQAKYNEVGKYIDPKKFFANEELYKTNLMLKKYPDKDVTLMTKISTINVDKADDIDLLVLNEMLQNPKLKGGEAGARELVADELGIDLEDKTTWDQKTENKILKAATKIREDFKNLQKVEADVPIDVEKVKSDLISQETNKVEKSKSEWSPLVNKAISDFKELTIFDKNDKGELTELYKYQVEWSDEVKKVIAEDTANYLAFTGQPVNKETITNTLDMMKGKYVLSELPKILKAYGLKETTRVNDEWHNKVHITEPISEKTAPQGTVEKATENWISEINKL